MNQIHIPSSDRPLVVSVHPGVPELLIETAVGWARAFGSSLCMAYVDESRVTIEGYEDGTVRHTALIPDDERTPWRARDSQLREALASVMAAHPDVEWQFRFRAGNPDRELTHLAHALGAAAIVVGTRAPGFRWTAKEWFDGSVALQLSRRQSRPVILVPLDAGAWEHPVAVHPAAEPEEDAGPGGPGPADED
ncbi:universal stress protein [Acidipropionibacterium virtanenii]|uniref:UspA domain-containing protein n=1 Tax=Acidipropionibacterium virtanenii TaxID=2057246 RepID=A0A344UTQ2_9ACTN|nr:universal stress protein [Acidipropionibacterium virtanenii]AXE38650.1 hypothetical protein JS278_01483 [Acidipropionibacterium virtanenii]